MVDMSLEERLYNYFYDGFERLDSKVSTLIEDRKSKEIADLEGDTKKLEKIFTAIKYATGIFAIYEGVVGVHNLINNNPSASSIYLTLSIAATNGFLSSHFHYATKLYRALTEKILKKGILPTDSETNKWRRYGRYSHLAGVISLGACLASPAYSFSQSHPIIGGIILGVLGYAGYHNLFMGYGALYKAEADFITGERRFQLEPTHSR